MATGFTLWFCLLGLYVVESLRLTAVRSLIFRPLWFAKGSYATTPNLYPGNGNWAWTLLPLWPEREPVLVCQQPLIAWGRDGFAPNVMFVRSLLPPIAYGDVKTISIDEKTLCVNGAKFVRCESEAEAKKARAVLESLRPLTPEKRETAIHALVGEMFGEQRVLETLARVRQVTRFVRWLSSALWWLLLVLFPLLLLVVRIPDEFVILGVGGVMILLAVAISFAFAIAAGELHPEARVKYRWKSLKFVFYPVAGLRALDELTVESLAGVHPVVLAMLLGRADRQLKQVKSLWQQARGVFPMSVQADGKALESSQWFNGVICAEMKGYLTRRLPQALDEEVVRPQNAGCVSYCPNCRAQYVKKDGTCADCPGVALRTFASL